MTEKMTEQKLSRRSLVQLGLGAAAAVTTAGVTLASPAQALAAGGDPASPFATSISNAYLFLDQMMDAYAQGSTTRMCQSYSDQIAGGTFFSTAFVYDNALILLAYLARGKGRDVARAKILGDALLEIQNNDPAVSQSCKKAITQLAKESLIKGSLVIGPQTKVSLRETNNLEFRRHTRQDPQAVILGHDASSILRNRRRQRLPLQTTSWWIKVST